MKQEAESHNRETIRGVIIPSGWDEQFRVTGLLIACKGEREIKVVNPDAFPVLLPLARMEAQVSGIVKKEGGRETIHVDSVLPLNKEQWI